VDFPGGSSNLPPAINYKEVFIKATKLLILLFIAINILSALNFRRVCILSNDIIAGICAHGFDSDQDGKRNVIFTSAYRHRNEFYEHVGYDRYILEDTAQWLPITDIGFLDQDSLVDMVAMLNDGYCPFYIYESPTPHSNPTNIVWRDSGSWGGVCDGIITDLDQDGSHEILISYADSSFHYNHPFIYEPVGDNQYVPVWIDSVNQSARFTVGDFDLDGRMDFATGFPANGGGWVQIWECMGNNNYQMVFRDTITNGDNNYDVFSGHDIDHNGKPEILFTSVYYFSGTAHLFYYEMTGDNTYDYFLIDSVANLPVNIEGGRSTCADVDADGVEEIVWSSLNQWHIYKAVGVHQYQRLYNSAWTSHMTTYLKVCDLNGNGYPEVIEAWVENSSAVVIWEIEGVRLHQPNGWEVLNPGQQYLITWEKFDPPGADSFALFFSSDNGRSYDTIVTGLSATDTSYLWTVPNALSDSCKVMIWAYGPPRSGEQVPRGTAWDFSDTLFFIRPVGITENKSVDLINLKLEVTPNPFTNKTSLKITGYLTHPGVTTIKIYDITGQVITSIPIDIKGNKAPTTVIWDGKDKTGKQVPAGIYFIQVEGRLPFDAIKAIKFR
jgi:hypothetical protein